MKNSLPQPRRKHISSVFDRNYTLHLSILILVLIVAVIPSASAFGESKNFIPEGKYGSIEIWNNFRLPLISSMIKKVTLTDNTDKCGQFCSDIQEYTLYEDAPLIEDVRYYRIMDDGKQVLSQIRNSKFYIQDGVTTQTSYEWDCGNDLKDKSQEFIEKNCIKKEVITEFPVWKEYNVGDVVKAGTYTLKHEGEKKPSWSYDWQVKTSGQWTDEWALWGTPGGLTPYTSVLRTTHTSNQAATNYSGTKILVGSNPIVVTELTFNPSSTANMAYILSATKTILDNASMTGGVAVFNYTLNANTSYYFGARKYDYASYTQYYTVGATYPINASANPSHFNYTIAADGTGADWSGGYMNLFNVDYSVSTLVYGSNITLITPADNLASSNKTVIHNCSVQMSGATVVNVSLYINNALNKTNSLTGSVNSTLFNVNYSDGSYNWTCRGCDSDGDCGYASPNRTLIIDTTSPLINITSPTASGEYVYNSNVSINYTITETNKNSCWYKFNGGATVALNCSLNSSLLVNTIGTNNLTIYSNDTAGNQISSSVIFYTYPNMNICSATLTTKYVNFSFKDETNSSALNTSMDSITIVYWVSNDSSVPAQTMSFVNTTPNMEYNFCVNPNVTIQANVSALYSSTFGAVYPQRSYSANDVIYTNSITHKVLYLLKSTDGQYVTFQVVDTVLNALQDVTVTATRSIGGVSTMIDEGSTDASGAITMWLNPLYNHTMTFVKSGYTTYSTSITPTQTQYTVTLTSINAVNATNDYDGLTVLVQPYANELNFNTSYEFNFTISSTENTIDSFGMYITNSSGSVFNSTSSVADGGILERTLNITTEIDDQYIVFHVNWTINGNVYAQNKVYRIITSTDGSDFSLAYFFTDLRAYTTSGFFGLDNFGLTLIIFIIIFSVTGFMSYNAGIYSPAAISGIIFALTGFFDVGLGMITTPVGAIPYFATFLMGFLFIVLFIREATQ